MISTIYLLYLSILHSHTLTHTHSHSTHVHATTDAVPVYWAFLGQGSGTILFDNVECIGNETSLTDCQLSTPVACQHFMDAGVICASSEEEGVGGKGIEWLKEA